MPSLADRPLATDDRATVVLDALPRLSFRDRHHTVPAIDPEPGCYLVLEDGAQCVLLPLNDGATHVGRGFSADVVLDDQSVSRRHAILSLRAGVVRLLDDRSANGTYLNGRRITTAYLRDGDVLRLGRVVLTFRDVPARRTDRRAGERRASWAC
jgi:pSer/pThr/pTyr-binding forkhead associated (FHA) protein